eukprot:4601854-Pyramimonas_sp.AAC.1
MLKRVRTPLGWFGPPRGPAPLALASADLKLLSDAFSIRFRAAKSASIRVSLRASPVGGSLTMWSMWIWWGVRKVMTGGAGSVFLFIDFRRGFSLGPWQSVFGASGVPRHVIRFYRGPCRDSVVAIDFPG